MPDLGDTLGFKADVDDGTGVLVNAQTVSLTITLPDGTTTSEVVANPPAVTGKYRYDYPTSGSSPQGRYLGQWLFTFAGGATTSHINAIDVGVGLVTQEEALRHLRAAGIVTTEYDLDTLGWLCILASDAVERDLDRVLVSRSFTDVFDGARQTICLRKTPVSYADGGRVTVTALTENGATLTGADFIVRKTGWMLQRGTNTAARYWATGWDNIAVTYAITCPNPPAIARKVALNLVQGAWQTSQQAPHPALTEFSPDDMFVAQAALTPIEQAAYNSLRNAGIA